MSCLDIIALNVGGKVFTTTRSDLMDKIRYSLLLKIHIQVKMLQAKNLQQFLYCLLYVCIIVIRWRLAFAVLGIIPT